MMRDLNEKLAEFDLGIYGACVEIENEIADIERELGKFELKELESDKAYRLYDRMEKLGGLYEALQMASGAIADLI